jgi:hypothetical protein
MWVKNPRRIPQLVALPFPRSRFARTDGGAPRSGRGGRRFKSCHSDQHTKYLAGPAKLTAQETRRLICRRFWQSIRRYNAWMRSLILCSDQHPEPATVRLTHEAPRRYERRHIAAVDAPQMGERRPSERRMDLGEIGEGNSACASHGVAIVSPAGLVSARLPGRPETRSSPAAVPGRGCVGVSPPALPSGPRWIS